MKKIFHYFLVLLAVLLVVFLCGFAFIEIRGIPSYKVDKTTIKVVATPARLERGKKLATMLCANCHKDEATGKLTGHLMKDAPPEFGKIYSQNITQDKTYGIGEWTDGEIIQLLRTGIKRNGKYAPPYMAKLGHMADEDIYSIVAFLHSDDPLVTASCTPDQPCEPSFLTKFLCLVAFKPQPFPDHKIELPDSNNAVALGKYLVVNLDCYTCHSADFTKMDVGTPENSLGFMGGGNKPLNKEGQVMITPNLTPDKETGIGYWSEEKFVNALKYGKLDDMPALRYPMVPYPLLTDKEAKAIYAYLQTIPPIHNKVTRTGFQ